jgi:hypothetical protein
MDVAVSGDDDNYEDGKACDSDDDRPISRLSEQETRILQSIFPGRDPLVLECVDVTLDPICMAHERKCACLVPHC